jgi:hypothetical protein
MPVGRQGVPPVRRFRSAVVRFLAGLVGACATVSVGCCVVPPWPGVLPVPRFRWLVCGSSLAGCLPVPREGFDFDFDFDFDLPQGRCPSQEGCGREFGVAQWPHGVLRACAGVVWPVCVVPGALRGTGNHELPG